MREKIVVTGAAGFIGSNLCKMLLKEGYFVVAVDNLLAGTLENLPEGVDFKKVDVCDADFSRYVEGASAVFHLAARNCLDDCAKNPVDTARINVMGTANVLQACVDYKIPHVIYSDTSAEYEGVDSFPSRTDEVKPMSIYACSKRGGALIAEGFKNYYGLNVSTVRYFNVYGPAQDWRRVIPPVMSAFTIKLLQGERPFIYGTGEKRRDFIHVDDVNRFHLILLKEKSIQGGVYNLGSGKDYSILEIFQKIENEIGSGIRPEFKPELPGEAYRTLADISETCKTGWTPKVPIEEGIKSFVEYTRERLSRG
ncbi:MAG: NAD-dependent epimerase/dehydratase family protein [Proteobacteria bacterium]|nr:NAD-dependent epimerase/dehydratase family protein [Pseudomonadota bacterium]